MKRTRPVYVVYSDDLYDGETRPFPRRRVSGGGVAVDCGTAEATHVTIREPAGMEENVLASDTAGGRRRTKIRTNDNGR